MIKFKDYVEESNKKNPVMFTTNMVQHPTGFPYLDYGSGGYLTIYDEDENPVKYYHNIGITSGSVNVIISKSQGGKTTLAIEMAMAIIEPYINPVIRKFYLDAHRDKKHPAPKVDGVPFIQILDSEKTLPIDYVKKLTKYKNSWLGRHVTINPVSTDKDCMKAIEEHIKYKVEHLSPDISPIVDVFGNQIVEYPPTVMIIDSATQLILEDVDDPTSGSKKDGTIYGSYENAIQNTAGARRAKIISALYSQWVNYAKRYNIIIFSIHHINKSPAIMGVPTKMYRGLRAGETIAGGERAIYLASSILRLDVIKNVGGASTSAVNLGDGIIGHIAKATWIKSKTNSLRNECQLVYTNKNGYDPLLSTLWNAKEVGDLDKKGNYYYLRAYPEYLFTMKNVHQVFAEHPEMIGAYYEQFRDICAKLLDNPENAMKQDKKLMKEIRSEVRSDSKGLSHSEMTELDDIYSGMVND